MEHSRSAKPSPFFSPSRKTKRVKILFTPADPRTTKITKKKKGGVDRVTKLPRSGEVFDIIEFFKIQILTISKILTEY
jgi:hypothetical protein